MIKLKFVILCLVISISSFGQKKDSVVLSPITDSLIIDANEFLIKLKETNIGVKDFDWYNRVLNDFLQYTANKRKKIINHK